MAPDKKIQSSEVNKGAIFTTIGFIVATYIYSLYTTNFARYDVFYGNLASIVVLIIWLIESTAFKDSPTVFNCILKYLIPESVKLVVL